jgi:SAM-dependent methyltransferase
MKYILCFLLLSPSCLLADSYRMPKKNLAGDINTLNSMGIVVSKPGPISQSFIDDAIVKKDEKFLDVGAAYGVMSIEVLKEGGQIVANDIDNRHLAILRQQAIDQGLDKSLTLMPGDFPDDIKIDQNSLGGILFSRVLHFFDGPKLDRAFKKSFDSLKPGSRIYMSGLTVKIFLLKPYREKYKKRKQNKERYPGYIENIWDIDPIFKLIAPKNAHFFDKDIIVARLKEHGFEIDFAQYLCPRKTSFQLAEDGHELLGIIARKPNHS